MSPTRNLREQRQAALCSGERKDVVNRKAQQERGDHQQSIPHTTSLETLADRNQQQHGRSNVSVGALPGSGTLLEDLRGLII